MKCQRQNSILYIKYGTLMRPQRIYKSTEDMKSPRKTVARRRKSPSRSRIDILHVVKTSEGKWAVRVAGSSRATSLHETQAKAIAAAKKYAKKSKSGVFVHRANGKMREFITAQ